MDKMVETNNPVIYPRPAKSFYSNFGYWCAGIETSKARTEYFGKFPDELDADAAAKAVCIGLKEISEYEESNASETKAD